jgi:transcriptional regulator with XRE-family HTH domain
MGHDFKDFMREIEAETRRDGPQAVAEMETFKAQLDLAAELILRRRHLGLTQRQLAQKSGIQQSEISRIEGADANPTLQTITALARALGLRFQLAKRSGRKGSAGRRAARNAQVVRPKKRLSAALERRPRNHGKLLHGRAPRP